jgi:hypothetical protein
MGKAATELHLIRFCGKLGGTPIDVNAGIARRKKEQTEINSFDVNVAAMAAGWFVFYLVLVAHGALKQSFAAAIELAPAF